MSLLDVLKNKKKSKTKKYIKEHHFLFIESPFEKVSDEVLKWSWSSWWPTDSALRYVSDDGELEVGKPCRLVLKGRFVKAVFKGEVIKIRPNRALQLEWRSGMMVGQEFVIVEERSNGTRIDHRARYIGTNILTKLIWVLFFRKKYNECIRQALEALKQSMMQRQDSVN